MDIQPSNLEQTSVNVSAPPKRTKTVKIGRVYTLREAAPLLGYAVSTLRELARAGKIPVVRTSARGKLLIAESDLQRLQSGAAKTVAPAETTEFHAVDRARVSVIRATTPAQPRNAAVYEIGGL